MAMAPTLPEGATRLWITFKLDNEDYCISSENIEALTIPDKIKNMPNNPSHMMGVMKYAGGTIPVVEMRGLLGMTTLAQSIADFTLMRQMHTEWIDALRDSVYNHKPFTKAVNPHKCKFGMWYDNFKTDNISLKFILGKIESPHEYIHLHGADAQHLMDIGDWEGAQRKYEEAEVVCNKQVLPLLDELIATYKEVNRGMIIVISQGGRRFGLMVDEIDALIPEAKADQHPLPSALGGCRFVDSMILSGDRTLNALHVPNLVEYVDTIELPADVETS